MKFHFLLTLALALFIFAGCDSKDEQNAQETMQDANATPIKASIGANYSAPFSLTFTNGGTLNMQKSKKGFNIENGGKPTLFAFFATWCDACTVQVGALNAAKTKYGDELDVIAVLIGDDISADELKEYEVRVKPKYKIAYGSANDFFSGTLGGIMEIPYMAIYDKKGEFSAQYFGLMPEEILTLELERIF